MKILFIEPFYSGSHKAFLDAFQKYSSHQVTHLTLPGKFWKWRMYGSAVTMAEHFMAYDQPVDMIVASDMMDLATFMALTEKKRYTSTTPPKVGLYFHENQFAYPYQSHSEDKRHNRDVHYGMLNYTSALSADVLFFNSKHNRSSFFEGLETLFKKMPDCPHNTLNALQAKSHILPVGIPSPKITVDRASLPKNRLPLILWNHRLEHDKNPDTFFDFLVRLKSEGVLFQLALLGDIHDNALKVYEKPLSLLKETIVAMGHVTYEKYCQYLRIADVLPVTSNHDFFGISVMEAIRYGVYPLLPKRLTYPDLYDADAHPEIFYADDVEGYDKLKQLLIHIETCRNVDYTHLAKPYEWTTVIHLYDTLLESLITL